MHTLCAICGIRIATTKDHIPPQSLYPKPRDNDLNMNTVPACSDCNNGSSLDDEIFKVLIGIDTGEHQKAPGKIIESLAGTIGKNARVANQVFSTKRRVLANLKGKVFEPAVAVTFDFKSYERVIARMIRALYWMEMGRSLAVNAKVTVLPVNQITQDLASSFMELLLSLPLRKLNKDSFMYRCYISDDGIHVWGMQFFSRHTTFAYVDEPSAFRVET